MKHLIVRLLDYLTPPDIRELEHKEEQARARVLLIVLMANLLFSILALTSSLLPGTSPFIHNAQVQIGLVIAIAIYAVAIGMFQRTGLYIVSGNLYALMTYAMTAIAVIAVPHPDSNTFLLNLLALPMVTALIANYGSGIAWLGIVTLTPAILSTIDNTEPNTLPLLNWASTCTGIFIAMYISHYYREIMAQRLNNQNSWLEFTAAHDPLTGLANRATFDTQLERSIELCKSNNTKAVLVYIDLDKFKPINDTYGHHAGDAVLVAVADRLRHLVRNTDTVARLGGDEFAILFDQCNPTAMSPVVDRITTEVSKPIKVFDHVLTVECSIGTVICPDDGVDAIQLSHKADERMYEVKRATKK